MEHKWKWEKHVNLGKAFSLISVFFVRLLEGFFPYKWNIVRGRRTKHWYYFMPATARCASIWKTWQYVWTTRCIIRVAHHSVKFPFQLCTKGNQGAGSLGWLLRVTSTKMTSGNLSAVSVSQKKVCPCTLENFFFPLPQALFPDFI